MRTARPANLAPRRSHGLKTRVTVAPFVTRVFNPCVRRNSTGPRPASTHGLDTHTRAFTLLELLVALAMAGIIAGSLYSGLRIGFRARNSAESAVEPIRTAELATALLRADFESALPPTGTLAGPFDGKESAGSGGLPADTVSFFTLGNPTDTFADPAATGAAGGGMNSGAAGGAFGGAFSSGATPNGEARKVEIGLIADPTTGEQVLVRRVTTNLLAQVAPEPFEEVLCRGVRSLNLRYYDGLAWQETWDSTLVDNEIPSAVELTIELERTNSNGQVRVIRFPRVFLLSCSTITPGMAATLGEAAGGSAP
jgi:prepilin-type N-terminal cleavage/methylation domain-containing protein